jgi:hypothetical protein
MSCHSNTLASQATVGARCPADYPHVHKSVIRENINIDNDIISFNGETHPVCQPRAFSPQSPDLSTPAPPVLIPYGGRMFEVRHLSGVRVILRKGARPNCWHLASPQTATAVASAYDAGLSVAVFRS